MTLRPREIYRSSLERCAESPRFIPSFYERFMGSSEDVARRFQDTNFDVQTRMLLRSLLLVADASDGDVKALQELAERAHTHDRAHLDVPPALYDLWLEAILETASEYDPLWTPKVAESWRLILGFAIRYMTRRY